MQSTAALGVTDQIAASYDAAMANKRDREDLPRFVAAPWEAGTATVVLDEEESRHALTVLRMRSGERAIVVDLCGHVAACTLQATQSSGGRKSVSRAVMRIDRIERVAPPESPLTLIVAPPKGPRLDWLVEKCTELGVARLVLAEFERSVARVGEHVLERQRRRSDEACKQCERGWRMEISESGSLCDAVVGLPADATVVVAHPGCDSNPLLRSIDSKQAMIAVVGPEGGLTDKELELLCARGGRFVTLGANILRVETAAIAVAACVHAHFAD